MYPTGYPQRSGNFSTVYPAKSNFDGTGYSNNMPSVVPGYGTTPPYRNSWGASHPFENNFQVKQDSYDFYDAKNGFGKSPNGYRQHGGTCWGTAAGTNPGTNQPNQRVCYGECKRSGRMCASCMEYMQTSYGYQKMNTRPGVPQAPPYPQRHPSWHGGVAMDTQKTASTFPTQNGYPLQRSNSTPSGYGAASDGYTGSYGMENRSYWGPKSQPIDINRRSSVPWYQSNCHGGVVTNNAYVNNNVQNRTNSCALNGQQGKMSTMRSPSGAAVPQRNHNAIPSQNAQMNVNQCHWNNQVCAPSMSNSCVMGGTSPLPQTNLENRPGSLPGRVCTFPPTPPAEPQYSPIITSTTKSMNTGSCQLAQVPQPVLCSPTPSPRDTAQYWNGPSPITKQSTNSLDNYQYCSQVKSIGPTTNGFGQPVSGPVQVPASLSVASTQPVSCASVPPNCDLENRDWQNDIADISATASCEVTEKARVFSAELEKLARLSTTFDEEPSFPCATTNSSVQSTTVTSLQSSTANCLTSVTSKNTPDGSNNFDKMVPSHQSSPVPVGSKADQTALNRVSETTVIDGNQTVENCSHSNLKVEKQSGNAKSPEVFVQSDESEDAKSKTKHSDYLNQTSDVNPYGSQNCIAALSASCRKMIADLDKPEKEPEQLSSPRTVPHVPSQQQLCLNSFTEATSGLPNTQCYSAPYSGSGGLMHHSQSFPMDPYMQHYPQLITASPHHGHNIAEKSRRGRKRKSTAGRGDGNGGHVIEHATEAKRPTSNPLGHLEHRSSSVVGIADGHFGGGPRSPPQNGSDTDLGNISPTFSDGPVNLDMLDSVFSPDVSLNTSSNDLSSLLDGTNSSLCDTFSEYESNGLGNTPGMRCLPAAAMTSPQMPGVSKERHPLEILQDQIKIQRQQFSLDSQPATNKNARTGDLETNNNSTNESTEKQAVGNDINDNHVIDSHS